MNSPLVIIVSAFLAWSMLGGCAPTTTVRPGNSTTDPDKRVVSFERDGRWMGRGIAYGPFRAGQSPTGAQPTREQIAEDLRIMDPYFDMIRVYGSGEFAKHALSIIREESLGLRVLLGAWLEPELVRQDPENPDSAWVPDPEHIAENRTQMDGAVRLANAYPDVVWAVNVGNETQVYWTAHRMRRDTLIGHLKEIRPRISQPITTCDDFNFWNKPESVEVATYCDFIGLHAYAMWNKQELPDAIAWTESKVREVERLHPGMPIVLCETGWATTRHTEGQEAELIVGEAGEPQQDIFVRAFHAWADNREMATFYFSAFDEPWKGPEHPNAVEKHWGLWFESREPKRAIQNWSSWNDAD